MRLRRCAFVLAIFATVSFATVGLSVAAAANARPRLLVLTDIGGDPDDQQSLVRLLHYANEFEIEGLIASAAGTRGELKEATTRPDLLREIVLAYGKVRFVGEPVAAEAALNPDVAAEALDLIAQGGPYKATFAFNFPIVGYAAGAWGADWLEGRSIPALTVIKAVPLTSAEDIATYRADVADPASVFEDELTTYLEPLGNISYATRDQYWNETNPQ